MYNAVVCLVGILGIFMSSQEIVLYKKSGIYEKGIIANAKFLTFSEIYSVPVLNLDESEQQKNSGTELKVIRKKGAALNFVFDSPEEKNNSIIEERYSQELIKLLYFILNDKRKYPQKGQNKTIKDLFNELVRKGYGIGDINNVFGALGIVY